jgi:2-methylcitrate dehydratase PrpD
MQPVARQLAEWCAGLAESDISGEAAALAPLRLLDSTGLMVAGSSTAAADAARSLAETLGGPAQSTVAGSAQRLSSSYAALIHGVAAHCFDYDDTFADSVVHPGSVVIPTAVAVAESIGATGADFRAAIAVGYEVAARVGAVAGKRFHARNMHATGIVGPIAAAATVGRLRRLSPEQISWAIGLAASMSGGIRAYARDGGWSKWLHVGWAAHGGITAADLAALGYRGPEYVLDGGSDLYSVMLHGETVDRSLLLDGLGKVWRGALAQFKYYPCAHVIHPFIEAVLTLVGEHDLQAGEIVGIECAIAPWAAAIVCEPPEAKLRFASELEAIGSLPYQLSVAVLERRVGLNSLQESMRARADIAAFARRVTYRKDEALNRGFDGFVEIRAASGRSFAKKAALAENDPTKVREKFEGLVDGILCPAASRAMVNRMLDGQGDWNAVVDALRAVPVRRLSTVGAEGAATQSQPAANGLGP